MSTILEKSEEIFHPDCKVIGRHWGELKGKSPEAAVRRFS